MGAFDEGEYPGGTTVGTQTSGMSPEMEAKYLWYLDQVAAQTMYPHGYSKEQWEALTPEQQQAITASTTGPLEAQTIEPFSGLQQDAFAQVEKGFDPASYQDYLSPYQGYVEEGISDQYDQAINQANMSSVGQGAFGGSRQGIMHSQLLGDKAGAIGKSRHQGFGTAMGMAREDYYQGIASKMGAGAMQQQRGQQQSDADYQAYLQNRMNPHQRLGFYGDALTGTPSGQMAMTMGTAPITNPLSQALGAGIFGAGIASGYNV